MKNHFVTSDLHIGHEKAIEFDHRPFRNLQHMHSKIIDNFNGVVPTEGITYFLGDIGFNNKDQTREVIQALNGTKICVLGNHDPGVEAVLKLGFDLAIYGAVIYIQGQRVTMSHCPLKGVFREPTAHFRSEHSKGNWHGENKNHRYTFSDEGQFHLHGHIHSSKLTESLSEDNGKRHIYLGRQMDVGCPAHNYRPVSFSHVESWIMRVLKAEKEGIEFKGFHQ